jgi:small-conductance mechanosensitive channel
MNALWSYFWPALGEGLAVGIIAGAIAFRPGRRRYLLLAIGLAASIALAALWHGPLGGADRFATEVERGVRTTLVYYDIPEVQGHLHHGPLTRTVFLSGPADDFQRSELVRLIDQVPGVESASWSNSGGGLPLIVEGGVVAVLGFLFGLLVAYLVELRRRYNAQWNW